MSKASDFDFCISEQHLKWLIQALIYFKLKKYVQEVAENIKDLSVAGKTALSQLPNDKIMN